MQVISPRHAPPAYVQVSDVGCPCCHGNLVRERRRVVDRLHSLFKPIKRYRCDNFACQWVGNIADSAQTRGADIKRPHDVPVAFIVHMVLVAAGVAFVFVYSAMEPTLSFDESERALGLTVPELVVQQPIQRTDLR